PPAEISSLSLHELFRSHERMWSDWGRFHAWKSGTDMLGCSETARAHLSPLGSRSAGSILCRERKTRRRSLNGILPGSFISNPARSEEHTSELQSPYDLV